MIPNFHMIITSAARTLADEMDDKILAFFGSEELMKEYGHLFVVEQMPTTFTNKQGDDLTSIVFHAETEIRIRPKTMEELEAEKK